MDHSNVVLEDVKKEQTSDFEIKEEINDGTIKEEIWVDDYSYKTYSNPIKTEPPDIRRHTIEKLINEEISLEMNYPKMILSELKHKLNCKLSSTQNSAPAPFSLPSLHVIEHFIESTLKSIGKYIIYKLQDTPDNNVHYFNEHHFMSNRDSFKADEENGVEAEQSSRIKALEKKPNHLRIHCTVCNRLYSSRPAYKYHMLTHVGTKSFKCDVCEKSFLLKSTLTTHLRRHSGEKPYSCHICEKPFISKPALSYHMLTHNKEKDFPCVICGKTFLTKQLLKAHVRSHIL